MALGLAIIFGQMGVINMAHGEFLTIGAYIDLPAVRGGGDRFSPACSRLTSSSRSASFSLRRPCRPLVERIMIRKLYRRPLDTLLATWGLSLIMQQVFRSIFGAKEVSATLPEWLMGSFKPTDTIDIPINGVFVMG